MPSAALNGNSTVENGLQQLAKVKSFSIVDQKDPTTQRLAQCLEKNHKVFAALRDPQLLFHNHMPHVSNSPQGTEVVLD